MAKDEQAKVEAGQPEEVSTVTPEPGVEELEGTEDMEMPIDTEEDDGTEEEQKSPEELALLLEEARNQADKHKNGLLRARAELDNLRKRTARDIENAHKYGIERLVTEMLPVRDSMELGVAAASEEGADIHKVQEGIELTLKMLIASMDKLGVEEVNPQGEKFDPELHQAMNVQEVEGAEPGSVVIVYQKGYLLNQRLVRPAMVIVAK